MSQKWLKFGALFLGLLAMTACESVQEPLGGESFQETLGGESGIFGRQPALSEDGAPEDAESVETLMRMGSFAEERGDLASAIAIYRRARAASPNWSTPLIRLGRVLMMSGALQEAQGAYRDAVDRDPDNTDALRGLANTQIALGDPGAAIGILDTALQIEPSPALYNSQGVAFDLTGNHVQAQNAYEQGLLLTPRDPDLRINLAVSLSLTGDLAGALELARAVGQSPAATPRHRQNYAMLLTFSGDLDAARRVARMDMDDRQAAMAVNRFLVIAQIANTAERAAAISAY